MGLRDFDAFDAALAVVVVVRPAVEKLKTLDPKLADELKRAATSIALNTAEGSGRSGRSGPHHFDIAYGSKREVEAATLIAQAWGYLTQKETKAILDRTDRVGALLWRARRPR